MHVSNENSSPTLTLVPAHASSRPPLEVNAIGTDLIDEVTLAVRLGVSRSTLQSWRYAGRGPRFIKLGRLVRYRNADIDSYLAAQTRGKVA
jgi:predicted DNA-binding transcriptional regulator AlpA